MYDTIVSTKNKGDTPMMYYYELKNTKTGHCFTATAKNTKDACAQHGYKAKECKVIYKATV